MLVYTYFKSTDQSFDKTRLGDFHAVKLAERTENLLFARENVTLNLNTGCLKNICAPIVRLLWRSCRFVYLAFHTVASVKLQLRV